MIDLGFQDMFIVLSVSCVVSCFLSWLLDYFVGNAVVKAYDSGGERTEHLVFTYYTTARLLNFFIPITCVVLALKVLGY